MIQAVATHPHAGHDDHAHHDDGSKTVFGFWVYLMSDLLIFSVLFATFAVLANATAGGPTGKELFDLKFVLVETLLLLFSSFTFGMANLNVHANNKSRAMGWLMVTFLFGAGFIAMEVYEFHHLITEGAGGPQRVPVGVLHADRHARPARDLRPDLDHRHDRHDPPPRPGLDQQASPGVPEPVLALPGHRLDLRLHLRLSHGSHLMSHSAAAAHGHDDHAADHGTLKSYITGFVLSLLLTFGSFGLVMHGALSHTVTIIGVVALCVLQLLVQLVYFLHMGASSPPATTWPRSCSP